MEEKFSVSLELMIEKFKAKAQQTQNIAKNVSNKIKENMSVNVGGGAFKGMTAESELLLNKINDIKATLNMASNDSKLLPKQDILEMRIELEKLESQYEKINSKSNMFSNSFNKINDGMNKSLKSAKRFTLSLFGIHSIYRMLSRASSSYLAQDQETSNKIQSAWIGLGSVFAPLLSTVANFTIKAVSYINVFIKALTGTDFLANAMSKSMNKANKSAGKLSKTLAGFDELTNLDDSTSGASVDTSWIDAFKNVELDQKIVKWLKNIAGWLKENKKIILAIVGIVGGSIILAKLSGIFSWLTSIKGLSMAIVFVGIATAIDGIIKYLKDPSWKNFLQVLGGISIAIGGLILLIAGPAGWTIALGAVVTGIGALLGSMLMQENKTEKLKKANENLKKSEEDLKTAKDNLRKATDDYIYAVDREEQAAKDLREAEERLKISGKDLQKQVDDGTLSYKDMNEEQREVYKKYRDYENAQDNLRKSMEKVSVETENVSKKTDEVNRNIKNVLNTNNYQSQGNSFLNWWGNLWKKASDLSKIITGNFSINGGFAGGGGGGRGFAKGLDVVPFDGMYKLHQNETVVPAKFTPSMHGLGNNNTQELINEIRAMREDIQRIEINPYTTVKDVGEASQNYRNKLSRIMGEELS